MRTLDELKAMTSNQLLRHWMAAQFPFETLPCGHCMTGHHGRYTSCRDIAHSAIRETITAMSPQMFILSKILSEQNLEEIMALRLYHDNQYAPEKRVGSQAIQHEKETVNG